MALPVGVLALATADAQLALLSTPLARVRPLRSVAVEAAPEQALPAEGLLRDMLAELRKMEELLEAREGGSG